MGVCTGAAAAAVGWYGAGGRADAQPVDNDVATVPNSPAGPSPTGSASNGAGPTVVVPPSATVVIPPSASVLVQSLVAPQQIADVAERVVASVVNVSTIQMADDGPFTTDPFFTVPFAPNTGSSERKRARSLGSGVVVSEDGKILTNAHVVRNADVIRVTLHDGSEREAKLIGVDPKSDLAVLRLVSFEGAPPLTPLPFADSARVRIGEVVLAVGNPFGVGQAVTMGIVSATGRASVGIVDYEDFIQTDAAINPGNSGGALVNLQGELIGINTAILSRSGGYQGIGFAIPTAMAQPIMDMLIKDGRVSRGWLGVTLAPLDSQLSSYLKLAGRGVVVTEIDEGTPAKAAGLMIGDVVLSLDGVEVKELGKLRNGVAMKPAGTQTTLEILREGRRMTVTIVLGELPDSTRRRPKARQR